MNIEVQRSKINKLISESNTRQKPAELYDPIHYVLKSGGKRLRPLLTLFGCYLFSDEIKPAFLPAVGVELFHNFTLVHDDIMDRAPIRRGQLTVHEKWDQNIAILSGDTILFKAYDQLLEVENNLIKNVISLFNQCAVEVCEGQQYDMNYEKRSVISTEEYLEMIRLKTAALIGFSLQLGAIIGGADQNDAEHLKNFGVSLGIAFQLKDDLLDIYGESDKVGKRIGGDIIANKKTYPLTLALNLSTKEQKNTLAYWLDNNSSKDEEEKVNQVIKIFDQIGVKKMTEEKIDDYFEVAFRNLDEVNSPEYKKEKLISFTESIMKRDR